MLNFIAIVLQLCKIFKIMRVRLVSFIWDSLYIC